MAIVIGDLVYKIRAETKELRSAKAALNETRSSAKATAKEIQELKVAVERLSKEAQGLSKAEKLVVRSSRDRKSTRLNSSHTDISRMPSSA